MRLVTYLFAAALLWAVATSGPATPTSAADSPARPEQPAAPPAARIAAYPR